MMRLRLALVLLVVLPLAGSRAQESPRVRPYAVVFDATILPTERSAKLAVRLSNRAGHVKAIVFQIDPEQHSDFEGDGSVKLDGETLEWRPPAADAVLRYRFRIDHLRDERSYDARCTQRWALFRGDDMVPPASVRTRVGAESRSRLRLRLPEGWSAATPYARTTRGVYRVEHPQRRFDRPTGWLLLGDLGVLREEVAGTRVTVAGPKGHGARRQDLMALLRWTLPTLGDLLPSMPERLLVVSAGDPMWRGGLSGPGSLFVHADRPLITEDGTSPLLHELMHTTLSLRGADGADWIVEGLAEFYALEVLRRSGTFSEERHARSIERLRRRGGRVPERGRRAAGDTIARAVTVLTALDQEIRRSTQNAHSLDDVVRELMGRNQDLTVKEFRLLAEQASGVQLASFFRRHLARS
jgi:hypothetical protein